jgi:3-hydroxy-9,10-secoandrosta-1,3,5(10)-triene-9,17-dione monooxygenase
MTRSATREPDADELLARARALVPVLTERAPRTAAERKVPEETIADFRRADLFRVLQPRRYGGLQMDFSAFARLVRELAHGCASSAWVYAVVAELGWVMALFPREGQDEVWAGNPDALGCAAVDPAGKAAKVAGGYTLGGQWRFVSGSDHAQWALLTAPAEEGGGITVRQFLVPRAELGTIDNWHVMGLIGTGSRTLTAENLFVPDRRTITQREMLTGDAPGAKLHADYGVCRAPRRFLTAFSLCPVIVGVADRALAFAVEAAKRRLAAGPPPDDLDVLQLRIAESAADLDAANALLETHLADADRRLSAGEAIPERDVLKNRMMGAYVTRLARGAVERLCNASGSGWIFDGHPLQTMFRDATAGATHRALLFEANAKNYARALGVGA